MKKILFLFIILLGGLFALYKMDIKPESKEVVKDVVVSQPGATQNSNAAK